jgi:hypothetical protein
MSSLGHSPGAQDSIGGCIGPPRLTQCCNGKDL